MCPKLLMFPDCILGEIFANWIDPLTFCLLDTAICSREWRSMFIDLCNQVGFSINPYVYHGDPGSLTYCETTLFHLWVNHRGHNLKVFQISDHDFTNLVHSALKNNRLLSIEILILNNCSCLSSIGCDRLVTYLRRCPRLSGLSLQECVVSDLAISSVPSRTLHPLTSLTLLLGSSHNITNLSVEVIAANCQNLNTFIFDCKAPPSCAFTECGFVNLAKKNRLLTHVSVACNVVLTDAFLYALAGREMIRLKTSGCLPTLYSLKCIGQCLANWMNSLQYCELMVEDYMQLNHYGCQLFDHMDGPNLLIDGECNISELLMQLSGYELMNLKLCTLDEDVFSVICTQNPGLRAFEFTRVSANTSVDILSDFVANSAGLVRVRLAPLHQEVHSNLKELIEQKMGERVKTIDLELRYSNAFF